MNADGTEALTEAQQIALAGSTVTISVKTTDVSSKVKVRLSSTEIADNAAWLDSPVTELTGVSLGSTASDIVANHVVAYASIYVDGASAAAEATSVYENLAFGVTISGGAHA